MNDGWRRKTARVALKTDIRASKKACHESQRANTNPWSDTGSGGCLAYRIVMAKTRSVCNRTMEQSPEMLDHRRATCASWYEFLASFRRITEILLLGISDRAKGASRKVPVSPKKGVPRGLRGVSEGCFRSFQEPFKGVSIVFVGV